MKPSEWNYPESSGLYNRARKVIPGGSTRGSIAYAPYPLYAVSGEGARVRFADGHEAIDFLNNFTTLVLGHRHPAVTAAAHRQLDLGNVLGAPTEHEIRLAELLARRMPGIDQSVFTATGSEAIMLAMRVARAVTGRSLVAKFEGGYHGGYDHAKISGMVGPQRWGEEQTPRSVPDTAGIPERVAGEVVVLPFNDIEATTTQLERRNSDIAALLVEPVLGVGGLIQPLPGFLEAVRDSCDRAGTVLVFDEVITQRLAVGGAQERFSVIPDLTVVSKVMGGGFPIAALGGQVALMAALDATAADGPLVYHSGTYNANPLAAAASVATLEHIDADAIAHIDALGNQAMERLRGVIVRRGAPVSVTGIGSLFNIHMRKEPPRSYRDVKTSDQEALRSFHLRMMRAGVMLATRGLGAVSLPMGESELDALESAFDRVLGDMGW